MDKIMNIAKVIVILIIVLTILLVVLKTAKTFKRRKLLKVYKSELLTEHIFDDLHLYDYDKAPPFSTDTYMVTQIIRYCEDLALKSLKKRDRYDKEGNLTPKAQAEIESTKKTILDLFLPDSVHLNPECCMFANDYRPYYKVGDFPQFILEYLQFYQHPDTFTKYDKSKDEPKAELNKANTDEKSVPFWNPNDDLDEYDDSVESDDTIITNDDPEVLIIEEEEDDDDSIEIDDEEIIDDLSFSTEKLVDNVVYDALRNHAQKLVNKVLAKGNADIDVEEKLSQNYDKLEQIFLDDDVFREEFVEWVEEEYADYTVSDFSKVIDPYIKYIKSNSKR